MARNALIAAAATGAAALAANGTSGLAATGAHARHKANRAPVASLRTKHRHARAGVKVLLDSSSSRDPDGRIVDHLWDLDGDGVYERSSAHRARIRHTFRTPGKVRVAVMVVDNRGAYATRRLGLRVVPAAGESHLVRRHSARAKKKRRVRGHAIVHAATKTANRVRKAQARAKASAPTRTAQPPKTLHAAAVATGDVTISDYKFSPASITIKVGDTVIWTNNGPTAHTATADDGSFDTGSLSKGATGSFKFTKAGTFSYHCTPHPYMKASVTVTGSSGNSSSGSSSGSFGSSTSSSKSSNLPHTGLQIASVLLAGLALLGTGAMLRRRLRRP
jgi:LPXTG-motif cell wall-anchored protein